MLHAPRILEGLIFSNVWIGWILSDDFVRPHSIHGLECLLMCEPYSVKFMKVL